jgi:hypothetical protein
LLLRWKLFNGKKEMLEQQQCKKLMKMQSKYNNDDEERCKNEASKIKQHSRDDITSRNEMMCLGS